MPGMHPAATRRTAINKGIVDLKLASKSNFGDGESSINENKKLIMVKIE